ncbi:MAG: hypothetical protein D6768_00215 [Chloroflexi bacterium]|nr:MAG: hypothetical protein D6768_00215 [Chloroflexota bacterium]
MKYAMRFASALTTEPQVETAGRQLVAQIAAQMDDHPVDLLLVFVSPHFRTTATRLSQILNNELSPRVMLGNTAEGVIGRDREIEQSVAVSVVAACLPDVELAPFALRPANWERLLADANTFQTQVSTPPETRLFLLLAEPFTTPIDKLLASFNRFHPGLPTVGGLASGAVRPGGNVLFFNNQVLTSGAVGVAVAGPVDVDVIVSQGCRPVGQPLTVTRAHKNLIYSLAEESPLVHLQDLYQNLSETDRDLLQRGVFIGRAIATAPDNVLGRGDFLIRGVMGIDQQSGALVVGDYFENDETVQFHLRDASTATEDLEMMLAPQLFFDAPGGGLLFTCNGRGTHLYDHPNGDISTIQKIVGNISMAGFFCAGEIGPIGNTNFLHGHTASMVLFRPAAPEPPA